VWRIWEEDNDYHLDYFAKNSPLEKNVLSQVYYRSCELLWRDLDIFSTASDGLHLRFCCRGNGFNAKVEIPDVTYCGDTFAAIEQLLALKKKLIASIKAGESTPNNYCVGCSKLRFDVWDTIAPSFEWMSIGLYPTPCNFKCFYCTIVDTDKSERDSKNYEVAVDIIQEVKSRGLLPPNAVIALSSGEVTVSPHRRILYNTVKDYTNYFITNASVYDEFIAKKLTDGKTGIVVSIDAGTRETFAKIKGVDLFERVVKNLTKYAALGNVTVKYIILKGINDNDRDYDGIIELCRRLNLSKLSVSADLNLNEAQVNYPLEELVYFIKKLRSNGITEFNLKNSLPQNIYDQLYSIVK
jgi:wyosine [tRNA(Phe)-imidazoG37] synthetase (radical SAM superfamily)